MTGSLDGAPLDHGGCFVWYKLPFPQCRGVQACCTADQHIEGTFFHLAPEMRNFPSSLHLFRFEDTAQEIVLTVVSCSAGASSHDLGPLRVERV